MTEGAPGGSPPGPPPGEEVKKSVAFVQICELGYCPYDSLYPSLQASDILTCDDCPHSVYVDERELTISSGESHPKDFLG